MLKKSGIVSSRNVHEFLTVSWMAGFLAQKLIRAELEKEASNGLLGIYLEEKDLYEV